MAELSRDKTSRVKAAKEKLKAAKAALEAARKAARAAGERGGSGDRSCCCLGGAPMTGSAPTKGSNARQGIASGEATA
jgi:membrane protein involved in colicin uptake